MNEETKKKMRDLALAEGRKIYNYPRWRTIHITNINDADIKVKEIREMGIQTRKMPIQRNNTLVGYRIQIIE